ncbi:response regulator [bacterium]|nr:response regulator [bacterium]
MKTVLLVENNQLLLDLLNLALEDCADRFTLKTARNGSEAYRILHEERIDLLITDLLMPLINGFELIQFTNKLQPEIPIIVITGSTPGIEFTPQDLKIHHILTKPFEIDTLIELIHSELALQQSGPVPDHKTR